MSKASSEPELQGFKEPSSELGKQIIKRKKLRVFVSTWNVGLEKPSSLQALFEHVNKAEGGPADLIVLAVQECEYELDEKKESSTPPPPLAAAEPATKEEKEGDTSATAAASGAGGGRVRGVAGEEEEEEAGGGDSKVKNLAGKHFGELVAAASPGYTCVARKAMWSMRILVLVRTEIYSNVENVVTAKQATGVGFVAGNKGGVAVGLSLFGTRFLFIGAHLAAQQNKVAARKSDYREIIEGFGKSFAGAGIQALNYYHQVFFCGDLNYRIDNNQDSAVIEISMAGKQESLLKDDQLIGEMEKGNVFRGFTEAGKPTFTPTYRFLRNTDPEKPREFDPWKSRVPSWCDRVLYKSLGPLDKCEVLKYDAEHAIRSSDHSPVYALFDVTCRDGVKAEKLAIQAKRESKEKRRYKLRVSEVSCKGLGADPSSPVDPRIKFTVLESEKVILSAVKTRVIEDQGSPSWDKKEDVFDLPIGMRPAVYDLEGEKEEEDGGEDVSLLYLYAIVKDKDLLSGNVIGQAAISLANVMSEKDKKKTLTDLPLMHHAKAAGTISLTMELQEGK